jgi:prepilin-type N-terminal cleavage/methylation domain-containing protein
MNIARRNGFTLLELLVVIGLIATMSVVLVGGLGGGGQAAALQSAQAAMAGVITAARTKAAATGRKTRLLVNIDSASPESFLRRVVFQLGRQPGASPADWDTVVELDLPDGIYLAPASLAQAAGLVSAPAEWKRASDPAAELSSDLFQGQSISLLLPGDVVAQAWTGIAFTPNGTLAGLGSGQPPKGYLVIATGMRRPAGTYQPGESPVQFVKSQSVRGLVLSAYGVPALLDDRNAF